MHISKHIIQLCLFFSFEPIPYHTLSLCLCLSSSQCMSVRKIQSYKQSTDTPNKETSQQKKKHRESERTRAEKKNHSEGNHVNCVIRISDSAPTWRLNFLSKFSAMFQHGVSAPQSSPTYLYSRQIRCRISHMWALALFDRNFWPFLVSFRFLSHLIRQKKSLGTQVSGIR